MLGNRCEAVSASRTVGQAWFDLASFGLTFPFLGHLEDLQLQFNQVKFNFSQFSV